MTKICNRCGRVLPKCNFSKDRQGVNGLQAYCKECRSAQYKQYRIENKEKVDSINKKWRAANEKRYKEKYRYACYRRRYGLSEEQYNALLTDQNGCCAICGATSCCGTMSNGKALVVDHDHTTGGVRGLLCGNCNMGLSYFKDNSKILENAATYLKGKS